MRLAASKELESVAFPGISTGIYGYPKPEAVRIAVQETQQFLAANEFPRQVIFVAFDEASHRLHEEQLARQGAQSGSEDSVHS